MKMSRTDQEKSVCCPSKTTCGVRISCVGSTFMERYKISKNHSEASSYICEGSLQEGGWKRDTVEE